MPKISFKKLPKSEVEFSGSFSPDELAPHRPKALAKLNDEIELKGFRKGHVPESILVKTVGDVQVWEEMFLAALSAAYPSMLIEHKVNALGRPQITVTKIAANAPVEFVLRTAYIPEIKLADYKKIRAEEEKKPLTSEAVSDKDVEEVVERLKKEEKEHGHDHPPVDDEKLKARVRESLAREKEIAAHQKKRARIIERLTKETEAELPDVLVNEEVRRMEARVGHDLSRMGVNLETYLGEVKKTMEEMRAEWRPQAEKNVKVQLALAEIATKEKIAPAEELLERESEALVKAHKVSKENARAYVSEVLMNELVFSYLEGK